MTLILSGSLLEMVEEKNSEMGLRHYESRISIGQASFTINSIKAVKVPQDINKVTRETE